MEALGQLGPRAPAVLFPDGDDHSYWHDRRDGRWETYVLREAIPAAIRRLRADPRRVAIGGISMGGYGAFNIALPPSRPLLRGRRAFGRDLDRRGRERPGRVRRRRGLRPERRDRDGPHAPSRPPDLARQRRWRPVRPRPAGAGPRAGRDEANLARGPRLRLLGVALRRVSALLRPCPGGPPKEGSDGNDGIQRRCRHYPRCSP